ncbi:MAG TPA: hypothetical protein VF294_14190, partial [Polyangiaceae bacterium]
MKSLSQQRRRAPPHQSFATLRHFARAGGPCRLVRQLANSQTQLILRKFRVLRCFSCFPCALTQHSGE